MKGLLGALRGASRGVVLLVVMALAPALAFGVAWFAHTRLDTGLWSVFAAMLALEGFLGVCALFGLASEVQTRHSEAMQQRASGSPQNST
jgi:hypothetical protein